MTTAAAAAQAASHVPPPRSSPVASGRQREPKVNAVSKASLAMLNPAYAMGIDDTGYHAPPCYDVEDPAASAGGKTAATDVATPPVDGAWSPMTSRAVAAAPFGGYSPGEPPTGYSPRTPAHPALAGPHASVGGSCGVGGMVASPGFGGFAPTDAASTAGWQPLPLPQPAPRRKWQAGWQSRHPEPLLSSSQLPPPPAQPTRPAWSLTAPLASPSPLGAVDPEAWAAGGGVGGGVGGALGLHNAVVPQSAPCRYGGFEIDWPASPSALASASASGQTSPYLHEVGGPAPPPAPASAPRKPSTSTSSGSGGTASPTTTTTTTSSSMTSSGLGRFPFFRRKGSAGTALSDSPTSPAPSKLNGVGVGGHGDASQPGSATVRRPASPATATVTATAGPSSLSPPNSAPPHVGAFFPPAESSPRSDAFTMDVAAAVTELRGRMHHHAAASPTWSSSSSSSSPDRLPQLALATTTTAAARSAQDGQRSESSLKAHFRRSVLRKRSLPSLQDMRRQSPRIGGASPMPESPTTTVTRTHELGGYLVISSGPQPKSILRRPAGQAHAYHGQGEAASPKTVAAQPPPSSPSLHHHPSAPSSVERQRSPQPGHSAAAAAAVAARHQLQGVVVGAVEPPAPDAARMRVSSVGRGSSRRSNLFGDDTNVGIGGGGVGLTLMDEPRPAHAASVAGPPAASPLLGSGAAPTSPASPRSPTTAGRPSRSRPKRDRFIVDEEHALAYAELGKGARSALAKAGAARGRSGVGGGATTPTKATAAGVGSGSASQRAMRRRSRSVGSSPILAHSTSPNVDAGVPEAWALGGSTDTGSPNGAAPAMADPSTSGVVTVPSLVMSPATSASASVRNSVQVTVHEAEPERDNPSSPPPLNASRMAPSPTTSTAIFDHGRQGFASRHMTKDSVDLVHEATIATVSRQPVLSPSRASVHHVGAGMVRAPGSNVPSSSTPVILRADELRAHLAARQAARAGATAATSSAPAANGLAPKVVSGTTGATTMTAAAAGSSISPPTVNVLPPTPDPNVAVTNDEGRMQQAGRDVASAVQSQRPTREERPKPPPPQPLSARELAAAKVRTWQRLSGMAAAQSEAAVAPPPLSEPTEAQHFGATTTTTTTMWTPSWLAWDGEPVATDLSGDAPQGASLRLDHSASSSEESTVQLRSHRLGSDATEAASSCATLCGAAGSAHGTRCQHRNGLGTDVDAPLRPSSPTPLSSRVAGTTGEEGSGADSRGAYVMRSVPDEEQESAEERVGLPTTTTATSLLASPSTTSMRSVRSSAASEAAGSSRSSTSAASHASSGVTDGGATTSSAASSSSSQSHFGFSRIAARDERRSVAAAAGSAARGYDDEGRGVGSGGLSSSASTSSLATDFTASTSILDFGTATDVDAADDDVEEEWCEVASAAVPKEMAVPWRPAATKLREGKAGLPSPVPRRVPQPPRVDGAQASEPTDSVEGAADAASRAAHSLATPMVRLSHRLSQRLEAAEQMPPDEGEDCDTPTLASVAGTRRRSDPEPAPTTASEAPASRASSPPFAFELSVSKGLAQLGTKPAASTPGADETHEPNADQAVTATSAQDGVLGDDSAGRGGYDDADDDGQDDAGVPTLAPMPSPATTPLSSIRRLDDEAFGTFAAQQASFGVLGLGLGLAAEGKTTLCDGSDAVVMEDHGNERAEEKATSPPLEDSDEGLANGETRGMSMESAGRTPLRKREQHQQQHEQQLQQLHQQQQQQQQQQRAPTLQPLLLVQRQQRQQRVSRIEGLPTPRPTASTTTSVAPAAPATHNGVQGTPGLRIIKRSALRPVCSPLPSPASLPAAPAHAALEPRRGSTCGSSAEAAAVAGEGGATIALGVTNTPTPVPVESTASDVAA